MPAGTLVRCAQDGAIAVLSLNRPQRHNAMTDAMKAEWDVALGWAGAARDVQVVVLRGEGASFCSGRDTAELGQRAEGVSHREYIEYSQGLRLRQIDLGKPVVAALKGNVIGLGAEIALAADLRVAADDLRLRLPEVTYGLAVDTGASVLLTALAGPARAKWLLMSGEAATAADALAWGLAEWVVPAAELDARALAIAQTLAARPAEAQRANKALVDAVWAGTLRAGFGREKFAQLALFGGDEYAALRAERLRLLSRRSS